MTSKPAAKGKEREIPTAELDPGMRETDDHATGGAPRRGAQPVEDLDRGVGDEHVKSASQGVRPER